MLEDGAEREGDPDAPGRRRFAGFRLYAKDIADVEGLARYLEAGGLEVDTDAARIAWTFAMDRNLTALFGLLVACAALGVAGALAACLWANVTRKRRELSLLRLLGTSARGLALFPLVQASLVALMGAALAALATLASAAGVNALYRDAYGGVALCRVLPWHLGIAALGVLLLAIAAGAAAVRPVLAIAPAEGLREE
jgi:putative ABC transport system permease protein